MSNSKSFLALIFLVISTIITEHFDIHDRAFHFSSREEKCKEIWSILLNPSYHYCNIYVETVLILV